MKTLDILKLLVDLRKGWGSKTVIFARLLAFVPIIDTACFSNGLGQNLVDGLVKVLALQPFFVVTEAQATSVLVVIIGGVVQWLRGKTTTSVEGK